MTFSVSARFESSMGLLDYLSPQELKMHQCLQSLDKTNKNFRIHANECLKGSKYYQRRSPSAVNMEMNQMIVAENSWFFDSDSFRLGFLDFIRKLSKAREVAKKVHNKMTHGLGVGVIGSAYFGIGVNWLAEIVMHNGKIGLFCAPGVSVQPAVGASLGVMGLKTLGCHNHKNYTGGFLVASGGFNTTAAGLPFSVELSYSLGIDLVRFFTDIKKAHQSEEIDFVELATELHVLKSISEKKIMNSESMSIPLYFGIRSTQFLNQLLNNKIDYSTESVSKNIPIKPNSLRAKIRKNNSLGKLVKNGVGVLSPVFQKYGMKNLDKFFTLLKRNISGCDAIGGAAALSPTLTGGVLLSGSLSYFDYSLLFQLPEVKLLSWKSLTAFSLLNPFLLDTDSLRDIAETAKTIAYLNTTIKKKCTAQGKLYQLLR